MDLSKHHMNFSDRLALTLTLKILEELPDRIRSSSNIRSIRGLLGDQPSKYDKAVLLESVAIALAYRTQQIIGKRLTFDGPKFDRKIFTGRLSELAALFDLVRELNAMTFAFHYAEACARVSSNVEESG